MLGPVCQDVFLLISLFLPLLLLTQAAVLQDTKSVRLDNGHIVWATSLGSHSLPFATSDNTILATGLASDVTVVLLSVVC